MCYSFAYVLPPTFLADWTPNTMSWTQWFFNTYKKDDNVYGSLGEIMNETETYWARSSRSIFAHSVQIGLSLWSFALLLWPIIATYESIEARKIICNSIYNSKLTDLYNRKKQSTRCCKIIIN